MKRSGLLAIMLPLTVVALASGESSLKHVDVFVSGEDGYAAYRIPAIETTPDGSLLAFEIGRAHV